MFGVRISHLHHAAAPRVIRKYKSRCPARVPPTQRLRPGPGPGSGTAEPTHCRLRLSSDDSGIESDQHIQCTRHAHAATLITNYPPPSLVAIARDRAHTHTRTSSSITRNKASPPCCTTFLAFPRADCCPPWIAPAPPQSPDTTSSSDTGRTRVLARLGRCSLYEERQQHINYSP